MTEPDLRDKDPAPEDNRVNVLRKIPASPTLKLEMTKPWTENGVKDQAEDWSEEQAEEWAEEWAELQAVQAEEPPDGEPGEGDDQGVGVTEVPLEPVLNIGTI